ncbi:MAG: NAD-dependent epimerase/dehydratase family protein [Pseudomonadales bacterium]
MKVLVTGTDGYIGVVLASRLMREGHDVVGLDTGYYRSGWLVTDPSTLNRLPTSICADIRHVRPSDLDGVDAVVHLAELSNDPLGESNRKVTLDINHLGSVKLANAAKQAGVRRFVYTSSCSVYGLATENVVDEASAVNPQTAYAECKVLVERDVGALASDVFTPVFLRNATAFGASPRMRFDIVLNNLCGLAWTTRKIAMTSDGSPWRPIVHIEDICTAVTCALDAPADAISGQAFNVGSNDENYRVREIAKIVQQVFPESDLTFGDSGGDNRSYKVNFDKIHRTLPAFSCKWTALAGAQQLRALFERIKLSPELFNHSAYTRLHCLNQLIDTGQIDADYYWVS